jgi:hypothetical protein
VNLARKYTPQNSLVFVVPTSYHSVMNIWSRIGAEQGGLHSAKRCSSADVKPRPWLDRITPQTTPPTKKPREIPPFGSHAAQRDVQFSDISNRFWPKNRSYRKQSIKPRLTGARTAYNELSRFALFLSTPSAKNPGADPAPQRRKLSHRI